MACERKGFKITWRIENYNFSSTQFGQYINSVPFVIEWVKKASFKLQIWPKSSLRKECMAFYVVKTEDDSSVHDEFHFDILVFSGNDSDLLCGDFYSHHERNANGGYYVPYDKVYTTKKGAFIRPKTLTVHYIFFKNEGSFLELRQCSVLTRIRVETIAFMGFTENFSSMVTDVRRKLTIKSASAGKQLFALNIFLDGDLSCKERVWIEVIPINKENLKFCVCKVFLLDSEGVKTECGKSEEWKFALNFTKDYLMTKNTQFLSNDTLTFMFEFIFSTGIEYEQVEFGKSSLAIELATVDKIQSKFPSALEDMTRLFKEGILCDMKLRTETETFNVHKNILSARSPVFETMFTTDMREKINDCVIVEDLEADTVRRMLMFLYSDNLDDLDWERAKSLYYAADKYNISALKHRCSEFLKSNLQSSNCCDLLLLSDRHQDEELKSAVQEYLIEHHEEILQTDQWMKLEKSNPVLTIETFRAMYLRNWKN